MAGMLRAVFITALAGSAAAGALRSSLPSAKCHKRMSLTEEFSKLTVLGRLNGHPIELKKGEEARPGGARRGAPRVRARPPGARARGLRPSATRAHPFRSPARALRAAGDINVDLSIPCPMSNEELLHPFTFAVDSVGSLLIYPQKDLTVMAAKIVSIEVDNLQISVRTPKPLQVKPTGEGPTFKSSEPPRAGRARGRVHEPARARYACAAPLPYRASPWAPPRARRARLAGRPSAHRRAAPAHGPARAPLRARAANGLEMTVTKGTATAMKKSFDLTGFTATVPFNGYFVADDETGELTLHLTDFDANFPVVEEKLQITGNFEVIGWMTVLSASAGRLVREAVQARALEHGAAAAASAGREGARLALAALAAAALVAAAFVAASRPSRRADGAGPLRTGSAGDSSA